MQEVTASVEVKGGLFHKRGRAHVLELEALKTELAAAIGERSGLFSVPRLVSVDLEQQSIATEFVPDLKNMHQLAWAEPEACAGAFKAAGKALAQVHRDLHLPPDKIVPLPDYLMGGEAENVALHGDFCWSNVCWQESRRRIVLLDWAAAPLLGGTATFGSRYFDLLWFSWSLFFWLPPRRLFHWHPERWMGALVAGYAEVEETFRWERYREYRAAIAPLIRRHRRVKRQIVPTALHYRGTEFLGWVRWKLFPRTGFLVRHAGNLQ